MMPMRIVFLGTPVFAQRILSALYTSVACELLVITQPDRPVGRKAILTAPPVKTFAIEHGLKVLQFERIACSDGVASIRSFSPDFLVTAAFGQKLSEEILNMPHLEPLNVHASLLPRYRGASPIQSCILNGDEETGVSIMRMAERMDAGAVFAQSRITIDRNETADALAERLAAAGAALLIQTIDDILCGRASAIEQDESQKTVCRKLTRESGRILFATMGMQQIHNMVRGLIPWPGAYAMQKDAPIKILETKITDIVPCGNEQPGELFLSNGCLYVSCHDGALRIDAIQEMGKKRMSGVEYAHGHAVSGQILT